MKAKSDFISDVLSSRVTKLGTAGTNPMIVLVAFRKFDKRVTYHRAIWAHVPPLTAFVAHEVIAT